MPRDEPPADQPAKTRLLSHNISCMKKRTIFTIVIVLGIASMFVLLRTLHSDGATRLKCEVTVVERNGALVEGATILYRSLGRTEDLVATTGVDGKAEFSLLAPWSKTANLIYSKSRARLWRADFMASKEGYQPSAVSPGETEFFWREICGIEIGCPKVIVGNCALGKKSS